MSWPYTLKYIAESAPTSCKIFLFTAVYYEKPQILYQAPNTNCSFAFVNVINRHSAPGWKQVVFFDIDSDSLERAAHLTKIPTSTLKYQVNQ